MDSSEKLLSWINQVGLSKKLTNLEDECANGFFIGELLNKFELITSFNEFRNKDDKEAIYKNYYHLDQAMRNLNVPFSDEIANKIKTKKKDQVSQLLYHVKMYIESHKISLDNLALKKSNNFKDLFEKMKFGTRTEKYDPMPIEMKNKVKAEKNPQKPFTPFTKFKQEQEKVIIEEAVVEHKLHKDKREGEIKNFRDAKINRKTNLKNKEKAEVDSFKNSMKRRDEMNKEQEKYHQDQADYYQNVLLKAIQDSENSAQAKIEIFNNNLSRLGLDVDAGEMSKLKKNTFMSGELEMQKMREKVAAQENARKEKERRKRKMNLEQRKAESEHDTKKNESNVLAHTIAPDVNKITSANYEFKYNFSKLNKPVYEPNQGSDSMQEETSEIKKKMFLHEISRQGLKRTVREIERKREKREKSKVICEEILDLMVDLAEECFNVQKSTNKELIEVDQWRNYMQMFVSGISTNKNENYFGVVEEVEEKKAPNGEPVIEPPNPVDEAEMFDYVFCMGQWTTDLFDLVMTEPVKSEKTFALRKNQKEGGFGRGPITGDTVRDKEEEENTACLRELQKNYLLGDCIDSILELKYSKSSDSLSSLAKPGAYDHVPIKICLAGKSFAGKKTQAKILSELLPLKVYSFEEQAKKALEILEKLETPIEAHPKFKTFKKPQIDQMLAEKAADEIKYADIKKQALIIRESRNNNEPVPDDVVIPMILEQINQDFPEKSQQAIIEEVVAKHKKRKEIEGELAKIKEEQAKKPKAKVKEEQNFLQELAKLTVDNRGFVIVDFPTTYNQSKAIENLLTGYVPEIDKPVTELIILKDNLGLILDATVRPKPRRELVKSGFDLLINLQISEEECLRRALGRRIDPTNGNIYHLEDNPPAPNDNKLLDRLRPVEDEITTRNQISRDGNFYNKNYTPLKNFEELFGDKVNNLRLYHEVQAKQPKDQVTSNIQEIINILIGINSSKEDNIINQIPKTESEANLTMTNINLSKIETKKDLKQVASGNLTNKSEPKKEEVLIPEGLTATPVIDNKGEFQPDGLIQPGMSTMFVDKELADENEILKYEKKFEEIKRSLLSQPGIIDNIAKNWFRISDSYNRECKHIFKSIKKQKDNVVVNFKRVQEKFYEFLMRPSKKQTLTLDFQIKYNKFLDDYPEMRDDPQYKEEHHLVIDELSDKIWESIEIRKGENIEERKKIMTSGYIELELEKLFYNIKKLFIAETDKFITSIVILRDYYFALDNRPVTGLNHDPVESIIEDDKETPLEGSNLTSFPRLEKIYSSVLKAQNQIEKITNMALNKSQPKVQETAKEKKKKQEMTMLSVKKISPNEEELLQALKNERNKYRFRINLVKLFSLKTLQNFRRISNIVYQKIDDWIVDAIKLENDSMNQLIEDIRVCIENEEHFRFDPSYDTIDLDVDIESESFVQILNPCLKIDSYQDYYKYDIAETEMIVDEIRSYEVQKNLIRKPNFIKVFLKKNLIGQNHTENSGIPLSLRKLSFSCYQRFLKFFEIPESDLVNIRDLATFLYIIHATVLRPNQAEKIIESAQEFLINGRITKNDFVSIEMWLDSDELAISLTTNENYNKASKIKELIFDLHKESDETMEIRPVLDLLCLSFVTSDTERFRNKTYFDVLFNSN